MKPIIVAHIVADYTGEAPPSASDKFDDDLGLDSLDVVDILGEIEQLTGWDFTRDEVKSLYTVGDMQALVDKYHARG